MIVFLKQPKFTHCIEAFTAQPSLKLRYVLREKVTER
jgi:hypothetical protein